MRGLLALERHLQGRQRSAVCRCTEGASQRVPMTLNQWCGNFDRRIYTCLTFDVQGYVLLSLTSTGQMPWSGASSDAQCLQSKENCDIDALSAERGCPEVCVDLSIFLMSSLLSLGGPHHHGMSTAGVGTGRGLRAVSTTPD
jgi:hypothetical protein